MVMRKVVMGDTLFLCMGDGREPTKNPILVFVAPCEHKNHATLDSALDVYLCVVSATTTCPVIDSYGKCSSSSQCRTRIHRCTMSPIIMINTY